MKYKINRHPELVSGSHQPGNSIPAREMLKQVQHDGKTDTMIYEP